MKRNITLILFVVLFTAALSLAQDKNFIFIPEEPKPGNAISLQFAPDGTNLENKDASVIIYSVKNGILNAEEYLMKKEGNLWQYKYQIPDTSQALGIKFIFAGSDFSDQVTQKTFPIQLFDKSGKLLKGTKAASAYIVGYQGIVNEKADLKSAYKLYKEEFTENPPLVKYYIWQYCDLINSQENKNANSLIKKVLAKIEKGKESLDEKQLMGLQNIYTSTLKNEQKAKQYRDLIAKKYPTGTLIEREENNNVYKNLSDIEKAKTLLKEFINKFPQSESCYNLEANVLLELCKKGKLDEAKEYLKSMNVEFDDEKWTWQYGSFAQAAKICLTNGKDMSFTEQLNEISLKLAQKLINSTKPNPNWLTASQYGYMTKEFSSGSSYVTAIRVYEKTKGSKEALKIAEEGFKLSNFSTELKLLYVRLLVENDRAEEGLKMIDEMISSGKAPEELLAVHKKAYTKVKGSEEGYEKYLSGMREKFLNKFRDGIKSSLVNKEATPFTLTDLNGKRISLIDYKGKIVILDFWATWCAPCKASFPLMEKTLEKYSNTDVEFLFVNTWERTGDPNENARKYLKENNYPFHCVLDLDGKVTAKFGITGIPTKVFIDKEGMIRYIAVGFEADTMLEEIDTVINLIK